MELQYYIIIWDTLMLQDVFFLFVFLFAVILSEPLEKPRSRDRVTEKKDIDEFEWDTSLFDCMPSFLCQVLFFFFLLPPFMSAPILCRKKSSLAPENGWSLLVPQSVCGPRSGWSDDVKIVSSGISLRNMLRPIYQIKEKRFFMEM